MTDIVERLLDSEEHATDAAIPQIAEDAVEEIRLLRQQLQECKTAFKQCQLQHTLTIKELAAAAKHK